MPVKHKVQCPIRLYEDQYKKVRAKVMDDKLNFQKLGEVLFGAYLKNNKEIMRLVRKYADEKHANRGRYQLDSIERDELSRIIEKEYSPLQQALEEIEDED